MNQLLNLVTLKSLKGSRTQWTIVIAGFINLLVSQHILVMTPEQLGAANEFFKWIGMYFFSDKFTTSVPK